jgi:hypothetical protein
LANALVGYAHHWIAALPGYVQAFIPMDKIPAAAGALSKFCVDTIDAYNAAHKEPPPAAAEELLKVLSKHLDAMSTTPLTPN